MNQLSLLSANNNALMQLGLESIFSKGGGISTFRSVKDADGLKSQLLTGDYDLLIFNPYRETGLTQQTLVEVRKNHPELVILVISDISSPEKVIEVLQEGTQGYLTTECDEHEILHAVFALAKGEKFYCNKVLDIVLNKHLYEGEEEDCEPTVLTKRETEITALLAQGKTNKEVALELHLSPHTVHTHRKNIMRKLNCRSASDITRYAMNTGLLKETYPV
jgi:two-component system invasion response regulator UvrY